MTRVFRFAFRAYVVGVLLAFVWQTFTPAMAGGPTVARIIVSLGWPFAVIEAVKLYSDHPERFS